MRTKNFDIVRKLIKHSTCNLNKPEPVTLLTPLCFASKFGLKEVVEWLVSAGCNLDKEDADGNSALHLAIEGGHGEVVEYLVLNGCSLTIFNKKRFSPIHTLAKNGDHKIFTKLASKWMYIEDKIPDKFERRAINIEEILQLERFSGQTPLSISIIHGHSNLTKMLLICGADPNRRCCNQNSVRSPTYLIQLCSSYKKGLVELDTVRWLLEAGSNVNKTAGLLFENSKIALYDMFTPLAFAARYDLPKLARLLVQYGADVNLRYQYSIRLHRQSDKKSPVYDAIFYNSQKVLSYFLNECEGIDYSCASGIGNRSFLHAAARLPEERVNAIVEELVLKGTSINLASDKGETALMSGINEQNVSFVRKLISLGANIETRDIPDSNTPLHYCLFGGSVILTKLLLVHGADINAVNKNNKTPFDAAMGYLELKNRKEIAVILLQNGCRVSSSAALLDNYSDEDEDSDEDSDSLSSYSLEKNKYGYSLLRDILLQRLNTPMSLSMIAVSTIRRQIRSNVLSVDKISKKLLPKRIKDIILLT